MNKNKLKRTITVAILLLLLSLSATAQFKTVINPDKRIATLRNDTLYVHLPLLKPIKYNKFEHSYIKFEGKTYRYKIAFFDQSLFWVESMKSKKKEIRFYKL